MGFVGAFISFINIGLVTVVVGGWGCRVGDLIGGVVTSGCGDGGFVATAVGLLVQMIEEMSSSTL